MIKTSRSFIFDPLKQTPPFVYGLEISSNENIQLTFFTNASSETQAVEIGNAWLMSLRHEFRGLDGELSVDRYNHERKSDPDKSSEPIIFIF